MDLNGYFDPVSLERPDFEYLEKPESFSHHITVHTPDQPVGDLDSHQVALFGVPVDQNGFIKGSGGAPDPIRSKLYQLRKIPKSIRICDLGNLKPGSSVSDTYYAIRDICLELQERDISAIILGGSQDLGRGVLQALEKSNSWQHVLTIDSMLDFSGNEKETIHSRNYLNYLIHGEERKKVSFTNLGHQACFVTDQQIQQMEYSYLESIRLGDARRQIQATEPLIRDSVFLSIDMGSVRHADAPGASIPSPNGFFADELCQITRYAGLSEQVRFIGFFELNPPADTNQQTAHLAAQAAWYFLDGMTHRLREHPIDTPEHIKKFIVTLNTAGHDIIFHKSTLSDRWWMEIPVKNPATGYNFFVSCSYEDYQQASNQEIPERWWRFLHRVGNEN